MHRLTGVCVRYPRATLLVALLLTALAGWSSLRTDTAVGPDANLGADHHSVRRFSEFLDRFGGGYPILIAFECEAGTCSDVFDPRALEMASTVSHRLEHSGYVSRVASPATARLIVPSADQGLDAVQLVADGVVHASPELRTLALADPLWKGTLVSASGSVGSIVVELSSTESAALSSVMQEIRAAIGPFEDEGFDFHIVGEAALFVAAQEAGLSSAVRAGIGTGSMLFLGLLVLIRSTIAVLASLTTIGIASAWTIGLLPILGWHQTELTNGAATLILVIGCADCVHFVTHYLETRSTAPDQRTALVSSARWVSAPCFLTTATTVGSFASFATGEVLSLTQFGVMAAIGISIAFVLTFTLFPALLVLLPPRERSARYSAGWQEVLGRITRIGVERRRLVLAVSLSLAAVGIVGIPKLHVEMDISELWGPEDPVTRAVEFVSQHLQRADRLEIGLSLPDGVALEDPETLHVMARTEDEVGQLEGMGRPQSLVTLIRHTNHLLRPDAHAAALPESQEAAAELLFLISAGHPGATDPWVTFDQRHARISFEVEDLTMAETAQLLARTDDLLAALVPEDWDYEITGPVALTSEYGAEFSRSQTNIVSASSLLVFGMIGIYLRSLPWALLAMIPNAIALVLLFGAMGHWGIFLNFGSAIVAPIAIGIAADDTIHFLTEYARKRRSGLEPLAALQGAISGVGEAVIATSTALALGFASMTTSPLASVADMGLLCAVAILGATAADLLMLPALIATVASWKGFQKLPDGND